MNKEEKLNYANQWGYNYIGDELVEVEEPLSDEEKIDLGARQAEALCEIGRLEFLKKEKNAEFKDLIDAHMTEAREKALELRNGKKKIDRELPCFYDPTAKERIYIDLATGEEVMRTPSVKGDEQIRI